MTNCSRRVFAIQLSALVAGLSSAFPRTVGAMMPHELDNLSAIQAVTAMRRGEVSAEKFAGAAERCRPRCVSRSFAHARCTC